MEPSTDSDTFKVFLALLREARIKSPPLILLEPLGKNPIPGPRIKMPDGSINPDRLVSLAEAIWHMKAGGNVGIYGSPKGVIVLDLDVEKGKLVLPKELCEELNNAADTFTSMTRAGGLHLFFRSNGSTANPLLYYNGKKAGECRCNWQYVVCPGSFVPKEAGEKGFTAEATGLYTIIRDCPLKKFDPSILPEGLTLGKGAKPSKKKARSVGRQDEIETSGTDLKNQDGQTLDFFRKKDKTLNKWLMGAIEDDRSAADYGVVCKLAFYNFTMERAAQILQSYRSYEKTDREDYLNGTITNAFADTTDRWKPRRQIGGKWLPEIDCTGLSMREITDMSLDALDKSNNPPSHFVRNGSLTRIVEDEVGRPRIDMINVDSLRGILDRSADFGKPQKNERGDIEFVPQRPPTDVLTDILSLGHWDFPALKGIICVPVILPEGTIVDSPGYEPRTRHYYAPAPGLVIPPIPDYPSKENIGSAVSLLQEVFCDFPFDCDASRANLIGLLITAVLRPEISGHVPMALIDKPQAGTGASLIASVVAMVATGRMGAMMPPPIDDEEMRKKITARLIAGDSLMIIDNLEAKLSSPSLAALLTTGSWNDRILGQSKTISMDVCATWIATGNNIRLGLDLPRRCYQIRMDAQRARPWDRAGFKHQDLLGWVKAERGQILAAIYTLTRAWIQAGMPKPNDIPELGSFEAWRNFVGGILEVAGIHGFLGNQEKMYEESDADTLQWTVFLEALDELCGDATFTAADIEVCLESEKNHTLSGTGGGVCLTDALPDHIADAWSSGKNFTRVLGGALAKQKDKQFPNGLKLTKGGAHARAICWRVQKVGESSNLPANVEQGESGESSLPPSNVHAM